jgi:alpha-tubulin suppressor-like RCC1 family protein
VVSLSDATTIASGRFGYTANCAIRATGTIACWANPTLGAVPSTAIVPNVAQVDMGTAHACALDDAGAVFCWGANTRGQLGDGTNTPRDDAEAVSGIEAVSVTAGSAHTCALSVSGDVLCWGANTAGQLGNGSTVDSSIPVMVTLPS